MGAGTDEIGELYQSGYRKLVAQVYAFTTDLTEAQDAVQEAFARALARRNALSDIDVPEAWLRTVAINIVRRRWRRRQLLDTILLRERPLTALSHSAPEPDRADLRAALAEIPKQYREVIVLHYLADLPVDEVAAILEVPVGTVKSRLSRGRDALKGLLDDVEAPPMATVSRRAGQIRTRRRTVQATAMAFVLASAVLLSPLVIGPGTGVPPGTQPTPMPTYHGAGIVVTGVFEPQTAPDLPGTIVSVEFDGSNGVLRTECSESETGCEPKTAYSLDGGQSWRLDGTPPTIDVGPPGEGPAGAAWTAASASPSGLWWAARITSDGAEALYRSGGGAWTPVEITNEPATAIAGTVSGDQVWLVTSRDSVVTGVYRVDPNGTSHQAHPAGVTINGEPVVLPDGRLLVADNNGRWQLSSDGGATFSDAGPALPYVGSFAATATGYVAYNLFQGGWVAISADGLTWTKLPIR